MTRQRRKPRNAQRTYGVLVGKVADGTMKPSGSSPHYEIWVKANDEDFRIAVNVQSVDGSEVLVHYDPDFKGNSGHDIAGIAEGPAGFKPLQSGPDGEGLDYIRDTLFPIDDMTAIPADGAQLSLSNMLDAQIERAKADTGAVIVAFGEYFQDQGATKPFISARNAASTISTSCKATPAVSPMTIVSTAMAGYSYVLRAARPSPCSCALACRRSRRTNRRGAA